MLLKRIKYATDVDTSNVAANRDIIVYKASVDKLDINKLVNVTKGFNDFKKVDNLAVHKFL